MISAINPSFTGNKYNLPVQRIVKKSFNYSTEAGSVPVRPYRGSLERGAGVSTEAGGYGGGYLTGSIDTPLSIMCTIKLLYNK